MKDYILYLVYSHIWLSLPRDDCLFFYMFPSMIATLTANKNSLKNHLYVCLSS